MRNSPAALYNRWLKQTLGKTALRDTRWEQDGRTTGWTNWELMQFHSQKTLPCIERDEDSRPRRHYRNDFEPRNWSVEEHMEGKITLKLINGGFQNILCSMSASMKPRFPFDHHVEDDRIYFILDLGFNSRERVKHNLQVMKQKVDESLLGVPTTYTNTECLRGDQVPLPRTYPAIHPVAYADVILHFQSITSDLRAPTISTGVFFFVPASFDIKLFPAPFHAWEDQFHWLLNKIVANCEQMRHGGRDYVNISRKTMRQFIDPEIQAAVKNFLIENNVIESDSTWIRGLKSTGYRLTDEYHGPLKMVQCKSPTLAAKMMKWRLRVAQRPITEENLDAVYQHLLGWLRRVRIDEVEAAKIIAAQPESAPKKRKRRKIKSGAKRIKRRKRKLVAGYAKHLNMMTVQRIKLIEQGHDPEMEVCDFGRVHTVATHLLTELRPVLTINGRNMANLDIRNSQIIFFLLLYMEYRYQTASTAPNPSTRTLTPLSGNSMQKTNSLDNCNGEDGPMIHLRGAKLMRNVFTEADIRFIDETLNGTLYDYMMTKAGIPEVEQVSARKSFKQSMFKNVFYGDSSKPWMNDRLTDIFRAEFPDVWEFILLQKANGYEELARKMQRRESNFMIKTVCERLRKHHAEVAVLTIHDSIMTHEEHVPTVKRVMLEEFSRLGIQPTISLN